MPRRDRLVFFAGVIGLWVFFVVMASLTATQLDDWYEVAWHRRHDFTLSGVLGFARYNYFNYNPRPGETLLLLVNGPRIVHLVLTPLVEVLLAFVVFALAHGRWPRADRRGLAELVVVQAMIWLVIPAPGPLYFYRPYTTNYLFGSCFQLLLFVPFRLELGRAEPGPPRRWLAPLLAAWGVVAGMTNEHTGPAAIVIAIVLVIGAARARRLRPWMIPAALGLIAGYCLLFFAPGQTVRYAGLATDISPLKTIRDHGLLGSWRIVGMVVNEAQVGMWLVLGMVLWAALRAREQRLAPDDRSLAVIVIAVAGAAMITITTFASPIIEDRVMLAACLLLAIAFLTATAIPWRVTETRRALIAIATAVVLYHVVGFVVVYRGLYAESQARIAALEQARPGELVQLPPSDYAQRDNWSYGEDLQWAYMREFVAHRVYDLGGLELTPRPGGAQPTPPEHMRVEVTYEPPLDARAARPDWPLWRFIPTQWPWIVREIRESLAYLDAVPGHHLRAIDVTVLPATPGLPAKPLYIVRWKDGAFSRIDARNGKDDRGWPYLTIKDKRLPLDPTEAWLSACGHTRPIPVLRVEDDLRLPVEYDCADNHTLYVCDQAVCWLAGRYW